MANRTLQFYGYAYGNTPVQLNAHINGQVVFSGTVTTTDTALPVDIPDLSSAPVLFSVADSALVPTDFSGSLPMTISVATGDGIAIGNIFSNYMENFESTWLCQTENSSVVGNVLTIGTVVSGSLAVGQEVVGNGIPIDRTILIKSGPNPDGTWVLDWRCDGATGNIGTILATSYPGNATSFLNAYTGIPSNTDGTADPRSSVTIDDVPQTPARDGLDGTWSWVVPQGSTIAYNLNVGLGNVA